MAIPNQADFLAHAGNADVAAYVNNGGNFQDWWNNYGQNENRQWQATPAVGDAPQPDYASRYHEIRGIGTDFGALGMDVPDYSQTAVSTATHRNPYHYVNSQTGELNRDQLQQEIQSGAFRFNPDYYAAQNPDLAAAGLTSGTDLMNHFLDYGWNEGRNYAIDNPSFTSATTNQYGNELNLGGGLGGLGGGGGGGGGAKDPNAFNYEDFMSQITGMFGDMQSSWQNQFSDLQSQWQNQQNQYQQYTDQFFDNLWSTQPQAATYMSGNWNDPYQQYAVLPPQYQANNGGPKNGFAPTWQQSNPFAIPTF